MISIIAFIVVIFGSLNWLCIGFFQYDLVAGLFGYQGSIFSRIVYIIIGICATYLIYAIIKNKGRLTVKKLKKQEQATVDKITKKDEKTVEKDEKIEEDMNKQITRNDRQKESEDIEKENINEKNASIVENSNTESNDINYTTIDETTITYKNWRCF